MELISREHHPATTRVLAAAQRGGVPLRFTAATDGHGRQRLPTLVNDDGDVTQSGAILRFVAALGAKTASLHGSTPFQKGVVDAWLDFVANELDPHVAALTFAKLGLVEQGSIPRSVLKSAKKQALHALGILERRVASDPALRASLAGIATASAAHALARSAAVPQAEMDKGFPATAALLAELRHEMPDVFPAPTANADTTPAAAPRPQPRDTAATAAATGAAPTPAPTPEAAAAHPDAPRPAIVPAVPESHRRYRIRLRELFGDDDGLCRVGTEVTVAGWVRTMRKQKNIVFVKLTDGSAHATLQVIVNKNVEGFAALGACGGTGAALRVTGRMVESPGREQATEMQAVAVAVVGAVADLYPLAKKSHSREYLRSVGHLRPRTAFIGAMHRVRNACAYASHRFFQDRGFQYVQTPLITTADCEGAGEMFSVTSLLPNDPKGDLPRDASGAVDYTRDFFHRPAYLTVSGQLNVEAYCCALGDVYTFGPTFRAEQSHTSRHLAEFWMIEPEIAFADLEADMNLATDYLKYVCQFVLDNCGRDVAFLEENGDAAANLVQRLRDVVAKPFVHLTYTQAVEMLTQPEVLSAAGFEVTPEWGEDLGSEHERYLTEVLYAGCPVIVTDYPKDIKAFYMRMNEDERTVAAMDILVANIGEIIGGSQREERLDVLERRMRETGLSPADMAWYTDLRRYGSVPHAGFGLGFERLVMLCTGTSNIRDVIPFPRWPGSAEF